MTTTTFAQFKDLPAILRFTTLIAGCMTVNSVAVFYLAYAVIYQASPVRLQFTGSERLSIVFALLALVIGTALLSLVALQLQIQLQATRTSNESPAEALIDARAHPHSGQVTTSAPPQMLEGGSQQLQSLLIESAKLKHEITASQRSEQRYRELIESGGDGAFAFDVEGAIIYMNDTLIGMTGLDKQPLLLHPFWQIVADEHRTRVAKAFREQIDDQTATMMLDFPLITRSGKYCAVETRTALIWEGNQAVGVQGIARDVTMRRTMELIISENEERLRRITDTMTDVIFQIDTHGVVVYVSPSVRSTLGYSPDELLQRPFIEFVHTDDVAEIEAELLACEAERIECRYLTSAGDYIWIEALGNRIFDNDDQLAGLICACRNITERKQAEQELKDLNQLKTEFLSTAAHELRTPLTTIRGFSEILMHRQMSAERQAHFVKLIHEQSYFLAQLIDDLLDLARLEAKRNLKLNMETVDLKLIVNEVILPFVEVNQNHHIEVLFETATTHVWGDAFRITQVIRNLVSNAVKYSPQGGRVQIAGRADAYYLHLAITDSGIGMTPEQMQHLFEKFYRANASNTSISGTGLGLAISKLIVEMQQGSITVESQSGQGSTFTIHLPLHEGGAAADQASVNIIQSPSEQSSGLHHVTD